MGSELFEAPDLSSSLENPTDKTANPNNKQSSGGILQQPTITYASPPRSNIHQSTSQFSPNWPDKSPSIHFGAQPSYTAYHPPPSSLMGDASGAEGGATDHEGRGGRSGSRGQNWPEMSDTLQKITGLAVGFGTVITDCLVSHPCAVIRYQCQINGSARMRHLTPFTLAPFCYNLVRHQGAAVLWKGLTSAFVTKGVCFAVETALADFCNLPREVSRVSSVKKVSQHLLLKAIAFGVATPFLATNFVELVQSAIATDQSSLVDYLRETVFRLSGRGHLASAGSRLLPIYVLVLPTVGFHMAHYCISSLARVTTLSIQKHRHHDQADNYGPGGAARSISMGDRMSIGGGSVMDASAYEDDDDRLSVVSTEASTAPTMQPDPARELRIQQQRALSELLAVFTGNLMADLALYPVQTILHRLYIQGTRTIIDSTDNGLEVLAVSTRYTGFFDCAHHIYREEGLGGFFRGFGALILQYSLQAMILRMASTAFDYFAPQPNSRYERERGIGVGMGRRSRRLR